MEHHSGFPQGSNQYFSLLVFGVAWSKNEAAFRVVHFDLDKIVESESTSLDVYHPLLTNWVLANSFDVGIVLSSTQQQHIVVLWFLTFGSQFDKMQTVELPVVLSKRRIRWQSREQDPRLRWMSQEPRVFPSRLSFCRRCLLSSGARQTRTISVPAEIIPRFKHLASLCEKTDV